MADEETTEKVLPIPTEIPWQLATTTRELQIDSVPAGSSVSIFTYVPQLDNLDEEYPDDRLVYLKISASVSSDFPSLLKKSADARLLLEGGLPVWTSVLDLSVSPPPPYMGGGIRPYFIAASPIRRTMLETGIVGDDLFEGESEGLAIGKSGSQMHESFNTNTKTSSSSAGGGIPFIFSASKRSSETTVTGERDVVQISDTTARQASEERRELLSHLTNVNNVFTLLTARDVGTPHLRFTLRPRPLRLLTIDPADPNLWYGELLRRRSSGIEGIQDYYAIAVIPRNLNGFCIHATLRNVYILDNRPTPPKYAHMTSKDTPAIVSYLLDRYPVGTPLDDLDVDVYQNYVADYRKLESPVVSNWGLSYCLTQAHAWDYYFVSLEIIGIEKLGKPLITGMWIPYKMALEVKTEMEGARYEAELARSPLERGNVFFVPHKLGVCFNMDNEGKISISSGSKGIDKPRTIDYEPSKLQPAKTGSGTQSFNPKNGWMVWNTLENQLGAQLSSLSDWGTAELRFDDPDVLDVVLRKMESLDQNDPANESLEQAMSWLKLEARHTRLLSKIGVTDLRGLATAINSAGLTERMSRETQQLIDALPEDRDDQLKPVPIDVPLSVKDANAIRAVLGRGLQARWEQAIEPEQMKQKAGKKPPGKRSKRRKA